MNESEQDVPSLLEQISTHWPQISDPLQFVLRYAPAVRRYIGALIKDPHDAEDVAQTFLMRMLKQPFHQRQMRSGRFRDYLKAVLRNAAFTHMRKSKLPTAADLDQHAAPQTEADADAAWVAEWRTCLLQRAWEALEQHEREAPDSLAFTALRLATDHLDEDSAALAARAATRAGHPVRPDAFRKQLSRARRRFAQLIVDAIRQTLAQPSTGDVYAELAELGLMPYVRDYLPKELLGEPPT